MPKWDQIIDNHIDMDDFTGYPVEGEGIEHDALISLSGTIIRIDIYHQSADIIIFFEECDKGEVQDDFREIQKALNEKDRLKLELEKIAFLEGDCDDVDNSRFNNDFLNLTFVFPMQITDENINKFIDLLSTYDNTIDDQAKAKLKEKMLKHLAPRFTKEQARLNTIIESKNMENLLANTDSYPKLWLNIAAIYREQGLWNQAIQAYKNIPNAEEQKPYYLLANLEIASFYFSNPDAIAFFNAAIQGLDDEENTFIRLSEAFKYAAKSNDQGFCKKILNILVGENLGMEEFPLETKITPENVDLIIEMVKQFVIHQKLQKNKPSTIENSESAQTLLPFAPFNLFSNSQNSNETETKEGVTLPESVAKLAQ